MAERCKTTLICSGKVEYVVSSFFCSEDISESNNLIDINIEKKDELLSKLNNWRKTRNAPIPNKLNPYYDQKYVDSLMFLIEKNLISGKVNKNE